MKEQAELAIEINVFSTIEKLIQNSEVLRKGVASGDLMVHGTVYNISSGAVKWLGPHPRLQEIVQAELPMHVWNTTPYVRSEAAAPSAEIEKILTRLNRGVSPIVPVHRITQVSTSDECCPCRRKPLLAVRRAQGGRHG